MAACARSCPSRACASAAADFVTSANDPATPTASVKRRPGGVLLMAVRVPRIESTSLVSIRARARAPKAVALATLALLCAAGLRSFVAPHRVSATVGRVFCSPDSEAEGVAQTFVRSWLSWGTEQRGQVGRLAARDADLAVDPSPSRSQRVDWTAVIGDVCTAAADRRITVAAASTAALWHVAVPISRTQRGVVVNGAPAIVGPPRVDTTVLTRPEPEVGDSALEATVSRVLRHFLQRDAADLAADLAPGTESTLPDVALNPSAIDVVTWVRPGRVVAATLVARAPGGARLPLRYELGVARRGGRWLVTGIETNTNTNNREVRK